MILALCLVSGVRAQLKADTLRIAVYDSPPFGMKTCSGQVRGLMVELWEDIAAELGLEYVYTLTDMDGVINGLQAREFDVRLGAISITPNGIP